MELADTTQVIDKGNMNEEKHFKATNTRKMFNIFFDRLYSNKIRAIIRELYSNAHDIHLTSGRSSIPPQMHLPTTFAPEFIIRDFGTGIHPDDIDEVYTDVFQSTKNQNNEEIGGFGLGSKTPFCYTSNFAVRSFHDGMVYTYGMYINDDGEPCYTLQASAATEEPDGLEVKFSVARRDFKAFESEAVEALKYFEVKPEMLGAKITYPKIVKTLEGDRWYMGENATYCGANTNKPQVMLGPVAYPLDVSSFRDDLTEAQKAVANSAIFISMNIGDVDVAPSRESLSYNDRTIAALKQRLAGIVTELTDRVTEKLKNSKSDWEKKALYLDVVGDLNLSGAANCIDTYRIFGHNASHRDISVVDLRNKGKLEVNCFVSDKSAGFLLKKKVDSIKPTLKARFYYDDGCHAPNNRCENLVKTQSDTKIYLLKGDITGQKAAFESLLGLNPGDVLPVSSLTYIKPPMAKREKTKMKAGLATDYNFDKCEIDTVRNAYYVVLRHNQVYGEDNTKKHVRSNAFFRFLQELKNAGIILDKPLYGLRTEAYNRVKKDANWVNLFTHLKTLVSGNVTGSTIWASYLSSKRLKDSLVAVLPKVSPTSEFAIEGNKLLETYNHAKKTKDITKVINTLNNDFFTDGQTNSTLQTIEGDVEFNKMLKRKYPVLASWDILDSSSMDSRVQIVADYVNLIG